MMKKMSKNRCSIALLAISLFALAFYPCAPQTFDLKDPKGVNAISFMIDSRLEQQVGSASDISGTVSIDMADPRKSSGTITIPVSGMKMTNAMMTDHLHGEKWLDMAKYPVITFKIKKISNLSVSAMKLVDPSAPEPPEDPDYRADVTGDFTCHGISKEIVIPVKMTYLKDMLGKRIPNMKGDLIVLRSSFNIYRDDFKISGGAANDVLSNKIEVRMAVTGISPTK